MHFQRSICFGTLLTVVLLGSGCGDQQAAQKTNPVRSLQLNWVAEPQFGGIFQAQQDGLFKSAGIKIEIRQAAGGVAAPQLVDTGEADFGIVGGAQILQINEQGGSLVALFAVYQHDPHGIMVLADTPAKSLKLLWEDEKSIIGCEANLPFVRALDQAFGTAQGARLVAYNPAAFRAGKQTASQCFVTSEPVALELEGVKTRVFMANTSGFDPYNTVLVTRRELLESEPKLCAAMVKAFSAGWKSYLDDPSATNKHMSQLNPTMSIEAMALSAEKQKALIEDDVTAMSGIGCMKTARWQRIADALVNLGELDTAPDPATVFHWTLAD